VLGLVKLERVAEVYTDNRIPPEAEKVLLKKEILLHKVPEC